MKPAPCVFALLLAALPLDAADKPKGKTSAQDLMAEGDQKAAAGDLAGAADVLRKAAAMDGAGGEPSLHLGRVLDRKLELDGAIDAYKTAGEKLAGPAKGEALGRLAVLLEIRGGGDPSATAEAAAAADAAGPWPSIALARARARAGKADEARDLAQRAQAASGGADAELALAFAQEAAGDLVGAEAVYRAADQARLVPRLGLARILTRTGRAAEAEPLLQKVLQDAPGAVDAYKESARAKMALGRPQDAMGDASTALALAEGDAEAELLSQQVTIAQALTFVAKGQPDFAINDLTQLRDKNPDLAEARVGLARALLAKRDVDAALVELQKAVALKPGLAEAQFQLGYVQHAFKQNPQAALAAYEAAVAADPARVNYRTNLGAVLTDLKQYDRAVAELTKVVETPGYAKADAWIYLGRAHVAAKRYKDAIPALDKAVALAPASADAEASLGWCYFGLKDAENFKKHAGKARSLGYKEPTLIGYLTRVEGGEAIK